MARDLSEEQKARIKKAEDTLAALLDDEAPMVRHNAAVSLRNQLLGAPAQRSEVAPPPRRKSKALMGVTKEHLVERILNTVDRADEADAPGVSLRGVELLAKLTGNLIERRETRQVKDWSDLSDEEVRALAAADERREREEGTDQ